MIELIYTTNFLRRLKKFKKSNKRLFEEIIEKVELFKNTDNHKALKVHKLHGRMRMWYGFSVNYKIRVVFKYGKKKTEASLLDVDDHDVYKC